jgi:hypothetical protein
MDILQILGCILLGLIVLAIIGYVVIVVMGNAMSDLPKDGQ